MSGTVASCLVTSTPTLTDPPQQPPYLIVAGASPDPRFPFVIKDDPQGDVPGVPFAASVYSSNPSENLNVELLIDYGRTRIDGQKAEDKVGPAAIPPNGTNIRQISKNWFPSINNTPAGCHTVTMIVSHQFDSDTACPMRLCDSSQITWFVNLELLTKIPSCVPDPMTALPAACACPQPMDTCPADAPGASPATTPCPSDDTGGGAT